MSIRFHIFANYLGRHIAMFCLLTAPFWTVGPALADDKEALQFTEGVIEGTLSILNGGTKDEANTLVTDNFAVDRISRFVVGKEWRTMTPEQSKTYSESFKNYVVHWVYSELLDSIGEVKSYKLLRAIPENRGERQLGYMVLSQFDTTSYGLTDVFWRLRYVNGDLKIVDLIVEGVSVSISQQTFFQNTMQKSGGIDGLISFLQDNTPS